MNNKLAKHSPTQWLTQWFFAFIFSTLSFAVTAESSALNTEQARQSDNKQPIEIKADTLNASEKQGKSVYSGNVEVEQGSLKISGDRIEVLHPNGQLEKAVTTGKPAKFKRYNPIEKAWVIGQANSIEYNTQTKTVLLSGNAQVEQPGKHLIKGQTLLYDITRQTLNAQSSKDQKQRVTVTFTPQVDATQKPSQPANPPAPSNQNSTSENSPAKVQ